MNRQSHILVLVYTFARNPQDIFCHPPAELYGDKSPPSFHNNPQAPDTGHFCIEHIQLYYF